jgi:Right handed beta helix region/O-Antigen ligase
MTEPALDQRSVAHGRANVFLAMLGFALVGYAMLGKSFAYLGLPPLYVGEFVLLAGLAALIGSRAPLGMLVVPACQLLVVLMGWVMLRTIPYIEGHGLDALRDSVIVMYGLLALIVIAVLIEDPHRFSCVVTAYGRFAAAGIPVMVALALMAVVFKEQLPEVPGLGVPILHFRPGDFGAHLGGAMVFMLLGLSYASRFWIAIALVGAVLAASQNRGGMLAMVLPVAMAAIVSGRWRTLAKALGAGAALLAVAYVLDVGVADLGARGRGVSAHQLADNLASVFGTSHDTLDGTKRWRLAWWDTIANYTLRGEYFWMGKGFGINLAEADGFVVGDNPGAPPLRSPHSAHMTILARSGVPGLLLWGALLLSWAWMLTASYLRARLRRDEGWSSLFLFIGCYALAILLSASVDVALEGPILGFWFWVLFGVGIAATMIHRAASKAVTHSVQDTGHGRACENHAVRSFLSISAALGLALLAIEPVPAVASPTPSSGPLPSLPCPPTSIAVHPGQSIQAAADSAGPGAALCLKAGIHRVQVVRPLAGQSFHGEGPATILSGAEEVTGFQKNGDQWISRRPIARETPHGQCAKQHPLCNRPIQVFLGDRLLQRVATRDEVRTGQVFIDPVREEIVLADDPIGQTVEVTVAALAFESTAPDVLISNLVVEKYKSAAQRGAIRGYARWTTRNVEARWNSGAGITLGAEGQILDSHIHHNGQIGVVMVGRNVVLAGNEIAFNNVLGFDPDWEAGGVKIAASDGVEMARNFVHHNSGPGLWCDIDCRDVVYEANTVELNSGAGIFHEISFAAVIRNNVVRHNGRAGRKWYWNSEIQIAASEDVEVTGNTITVGDLGRAILLIDQSRTKKNGSTYKTRRNRVHHNVIHFEGRGEAGGASDVKPGDENFGIIANGDNRFDHNIYRLARTAPPPRFVWSQELYDWEGFRALGQEISGSLIAD